MFFSSVWSFIKHTQVSSSNHRYSSIMFPWHHGRQWFVTTPHKRKWPTPPPDMRHLVDFSLNLIFGPVSDDFVIFCSFSGGVEFFRLRNLIEIGILKSCFVVGFHNACTTTRGTLFTWKTSRHRFPWPGFDQYDKGQEMFAFLRHLMRSGSVLVKPLLLGRNKESQDSSCWWTKCCTSWNTCWLTWRVG